MLGRSTFLAQLEAHSRLVLRPPGYTVAVAVERLVVEHMLVPATCCDPVRPSSEFLCSIVDGQPDNVAALRRFETGVALVVVDACRGHLLVCSQIRHFC